MGMFLNPGNAGFALAIRSEIYVDKSGLLEFTNSVLGTEQRMVCVSRPRRFGKSMAAKMLAAYYSKGCNSKKLFQNLQIAEAPDFEDELNGHNVIYMDIQWFRSIAKDKGIVEQTVFYIQQEVIRELREQYPKIVTKKDISLPEVLLRIHSATDEQFIIIIDEWDCIFREDKENKAQQEIYINFLRGMFKGILAESTIELVYLTGILPIKKFGTQSALNNFDEYTMLDPTPLEEYVGFTENEVQELCSRYGLDFDIAKRWYDGYVFADALHVYSPKSMLDAIRKKKMGSYWTKTETYESLKYYIEMNYDNLRDDIIRMLDGDSVSVDTGAFQNDMISFRSRDDVLTLLIHLGYLAYYEGEVFIPNEEVREEFYRAVRTTNWDEIIKMAQRSDELLEATWAMDAAKVAKLLDEAHENPAVSHLQYNNENSLSYVIANAYFCAAKDYTWIRELPTGKGFADIVYLPKRAHDKPAMLVELKWNQSAKGAIAQIKEKKYVKAIENYGGEILLVGVNYDKKTRKHQCVIEKYQKENRVKTGC